MEPSIPPVVRLDAPTDSTVSLLTATLVEALRGRGYRTASAERRPGGAGLAVTLPSGGRIGVERDVAEADLGAFVATLDPRADLVLAFGYEDPLDAPAHGDRAHVGRHAARHRRRRRAHVEPPLAWAARRSSTTSRHSSTRACSAAARSPRAVG